MLIALCMVFRMCSPKKRNYTAEISLALSLGALSMSLPNRFEFFFLATGEYQMAPTLAKFTSQFLRDGGRSTD